MGLVNRAMYFVIENLFQPQTKIVFRFKTKLESKFVEKRNFVSCLFARM